MMIQGGGDDHVFIGQEEYLTIRWIEIREAA
jgi:hypothetical protein